MIGVGIFTLDGEFGSYKCFSVVSTIILLYHMCGGWFADGWLGQGCWYLCKCVSKFSLPERWSYYLVCLDDSGRFWYTSGV